MPKFCHLNNLDRKRHIKASFGFLVRILLNAIETGFFHWRVNTDYDNIMTINSPQMNISTFCLIVCHVPIPPNQNNTTKKDELMRRENVLGKNTAHWTIFRDGVWIQACRTAVWIDFAFGRLGLTKAQSSWLAQVGCGVLIGQSACRLLALLLFLLLFRHSAKS